MILNSLISGMTWEESRLDSPSVSSASGLLSPSSGPSRRENSSTSGIAFNSDTLSSPAAKASMPAADGSSSEDVEDDWINVSQDDFDIFDFVKKYGATPPRS